MSRKNVIGIEPILTGSRPVVLTITLYIPNAIGVEPIYTGSRPVMLPLHHTF